VALASSPLAIPARRGFRIAAVLEYWHLLSLDAPTVAFLWAWGFARACRVDLPLTSPLLLALGTWLIYVADRMLDSRNQGTPGALRERHFFHGRNRVAFLVAAVPAAVVLAWLIATQMSHSERRADMALFAAALLYFGLVHSCAGGGVLAACRMERWFPKEMVVGIIFAAAAAVPAWAVLGGRRAELLPMTVLFAALCWLNCAAIEKWEQPRARGHVTTDWMRSHLLLAGSVLAVVAFLAAGAELMRGLPPGVGGLYSAGALSAILLLVLDRSGLNAMQLRIAADMALLTPLLLLLR
jgi:hypothetical protein